MHLRITVEEEADFGLGPFAVNYDRNTAVDTTIPIFIDYNTILVNYRTDGPSFFSYLMAFGWEVWLGLILSLLTISLIACFFDNVMSNNLKTTGWISSFPEYVWKFYGNLLYQGSSQQRILHHQRLLQAFWCLIVIVLMQSFSGHLMATLVMKRDVQINSLEDLEKSGLLPGVEKGSSLHSMFMYDQEPLHRKLYYRMIQQESKSFLKISKLVSDPVLELVKKEKFAVVCDSLAIKSALASRYERGGVCDFHIAEEKFHRLILVMTLRKDLPKSVFREINKSVFSLVEGQLLTATINNYIGKYRRCIGRKQEGTNPLSVEDLQSVFILLASGILLGVFTLLLERFYGRVRNI
ncbi:putative glutamate receptor isoform X2 [Tachypleus tridentatus]|uniref:putative glutamate receptor isoform X2 n=1 Tax=Tachypleus tridentatus TaxID=6853 RepID=UPI003FD3019F